MVVVVVVCVYVCACVWCVCVGEDKMMPGMKLWRHSNVIIYQIDDIILV